MRRKLNNTNAFIEFLFRSLINSRFLLFHLLPSSNSDPVGVMYIALTTAEEQCTIGSDTRSTSRALEALVQPCARSAWELLVHYVRNDSLECAHAPAS